MSLEISAGHGGCSPFVALGCSPWGEGYKIGNKVVREYCFLKTLFVAFHRYILNLEEII